MNKPRILLIDDDEGFRETVQEFLELRGYEVRITSDSAEARALAVNEDLALAIIDIRLHENEGEEDVSGLTLAKQLHPYLPKIILTAFPDHQHVREMLKPGPDGKSIAIGFVAKQEGLPALLPSIRLALAQLPPTFKDHVLQEFQVPMLTALRERLADLGVQDSLQRLRAAIEKTTSELKLLREAARHRAAQLHKFGLLAKTAALTLLSVAIVSLLLDATNGGLFSAIASGLAEGVNLLYGRQEKQAIKGADRLFEELYNAEQDKHLMQFCEALENPQERAACRKKIIDFILLRRSA